jgi:hypothetical protein
MRLTGGFSPARASRRWTRLDDYIADYQSGFFRNGAIPSGQFIITAASVGEYKDIRNKLEAQHRGANKTNNAMYTYRPVDSSGAEQNAKIEWVPFSTPNKDLSLKDLFEQANNKIDSTYGVPEEIRGHVRNSNLASAQVAERLFVMWTLRPMTMKIWDKMTHELARITNGFGGAITFDLPVPKVAEEDKQIAETKKTDAETIIAMTGAGYDLESIITAMGYPKEYKKLVAVAEEEPDEETVQESGEPDDAPEVDLDNALRAVGEADNLISKVISDTDRKEYERKIETIALSEINEMVNQAAENVKSMQIDEDDERFMNAMFSALLPLVAIYGRQQNAQGAALLVQAGLNTSNMPAGYAMTEAQQVEYRQYLRKVARGFNSDTAEKIRRTISEGIEQGLSTTQIQSNLRQIPQVDRHRATRLGVSEVNRAHNRASFTAMDNIREATGYEIVKVWRRTGDEDCPICEAMEGKEISVERSFWDEGDTIIGADGKQYTNTFVSAETADGHPYCQCIMEYEVR